MEPDLVARLSKHPNIVGIKDSSGNIDQLSQIVSICEEGFVVLTGSAPVFFPALCVGAAGGILAVANSCPQECVQIQNIFNEGKLDEARALQNRLTPLAKALNPALTFGNIPPVIISFLIRP